MAAINFKGEGGKNIVYSQSFSGHRECFVISENVFTDCDFRPSPGGGGWAGSPCPSSMLTLFTSGFFPQISFSFKFSLSFGHLYPPLTFQTVLPGSQPYLQRLSVSKSGSEDNFIWKEISISSRFEKLHEAILQNILPPSKSSSPQPGDRPRLVLWFREEEPAKPIYTVALRGVSP